MKSFLFPAFIAAFSLTLPIWAQEGSVPNAAAMLREIDVMEGKQLDTKSREKNAVLAAIRAAAINGGAAVNFYEKAVEEVEFKGRKDKAAAFMDWKKENADLLRSKEMQSALLLHLRYLAMALQRQGMEQPEKMIPALMAYVNELVSQDKLLADESTLPDAAKELLQQPIGQSYFAQWLNLEQWLPEGGVWESNPGEVTGILEKNIRPLLREKKDPAILQTWDLQLKIEAARITEGRSDLQIGKFNTITRPTLQFNQAQDMVLVGQLNSGVNKMFALVRENPTHPDFASWVSTLRELLQAQTDLNSPQ